MGFQEAADYYNSWKKCEHLLSDVLALIRAGNFEELKALEKKIAEAIDE
jgi:hypothetical protein